MKITATEFERIQGWIYRNARPLDLARWNYHFKQASCDPIVAALYAYQNPDGGFAHALEPDAWNPFSSPMQTSTAIERIEEIGGLDNDHPIILGILKYLASGADFIANRWCNVIPSNNDFPHAPWWNSASDSRERSEYNPTAILVGFILKYAEKDSILYQQALNLMQEIIALHTKQPLLEMHPLLCLDFLYVKMLEVGLDNTIGFRKAREKCYQDMSAVIKQDMDHYNEYACLPTVFITTPAHLLYAELKEAVDKDIQWKISARNEQGLWDLSWAWSNYLEAFAISANWWKADLAIRNLLILKNFGLLEGY